MEIFIPKSEKFQTGTFRAQKKKKEKEKKTTLKFLLYFRKWNFLVTRVETFGRKFAKSEKHTKKQTKKKVFLTFRDGCLLSHKIIKIPQDACLLVANKNIYTPG